MPPTIAIIPARTGSKGIPNKNFKPLAGVPTYWRAVRVAEELGIPSYITTDDEFYRGPFAPSSIHFLYAPAPLHTDTCSMIDVVKDVLARVPGPADEIVVLLQPTQPLRRADDVMRAIQLLKRNRHADSVVSVIPLPRTYAPEFICEIKNADVPYVQRAQVSNLDHVGTMRGFPGTRQSIPQPYVRDGTVYAFRRGTVSKYGDIYGNTTLPVIIDPAHTCSLDTMADWDEAARRLA